MLQHDQVVYRVQTRHCGKTTRSGFSFIYLQPSRKSWLLYFSADSFVMLCSSVMPTRGQAQAVTSPAIPEAAVDAASQSSTSKPSNLPTPSNAAEAAVPVSGTGAATPAFTPSTDPYSNFRWKGVIISLPGPSDTIDGDPGGLRQKLAQDYGVGYLGYSINIFYDNTLHAAHSIGGNQVYLGQRSTFISANSIAALIDLSRYGISDGQIVVSGYYERTS